MRMSKLAVTIFIFIIFAIELTVNVSIGAGVNQALSLNQLYKNMDELHNSKIKVKGYLSAFSSFYDINFILTDGERSITIEPINVDLIRWVGREVEIYGILNAKSMKIEVLSVTIPDGSAPPAFSQSIATSLEKSPLGGQPTYIIPVKFPDMEPTKNITDIMSVVDEAANEYYPEISYNLTWFNCKFIDNWLLMPQNMSYYAADNETTREDLIQDAISLADPIINYTKYYRIIIVHAGWDEALTRNESDIWSFAVLGDFLISTDDGQVRISVAVVSEFDPLGVYVHEMGHMLGLPDLYDENYEVEFMGKWDLMAKGMWNGDPIGSSPAHPSSACKISLGWLSGESIVEVGPGSFLTVTLNPIEDASGVRAIKIPITDQVYYLVEVRRKVNYDTYLPGEGVLILFVNESNPSGEGPVRLIDAKPKTATLDDAYFTVGSSWSNDAYNITIRIEGVEGSAYVISIFYEDAVIVDAAEVSKSRADVGSIQYVSFHLKWNSTGENASQITIEINGSTYTTDDEGWAIVEVNSSEVGKQVWTVSAAYIDDIPITVVMEVEAPYIIWDKVIVTLKVPIEKQRVSINGNATIYYEAVYAYDNDLFKGEVILNGSTSWPLIGPRWYTVQKIIDNKYNLTTFESNVVKVIFDALKVKAEVEKQLYNPEEKFEVKVKLMYASDDTPIVGGIVELDGNQMPTGIGGIARFTVTAPNVTGEYAIRVEGVSDGKSVNIPYNRETLKLIVTKIIIDNISPRNIRIEVGEPLRIGIHAIWAHNSSSAENVQLQIYNRKIVTGSDGWAFLEIAMDTISRVDLTVDEVLAPEGIYTFYQPISAYIIWDELKVEVEYHALIPGSIKAVVKVRYVYDNQPVDNAKVTINGMKTARVEEGTYTIVIDFWGLMVKLEVLVEVEGFKP
ncbi:MAG: hypothetical protein DRJ26_04975, partial [Candidatus Methanomethylicota archaeon]